MESNSSTRHILSYLKGAFKKWLPAFAIAFVAVLLFHFIFVTERGLCSAVVNFSYDGIESGLDPNGNRFDPSEIKDADIVRQAAEAIGESVTPENMEAIQDALTIQGSVPSDVLQDIINNASIYGDELSSVTEVGESAYFPSQYTVTFRYNDAGFTAAQGTRFLEELLKAYETSFYERYGYNSSFERILSAVDYDAYDYVNSVEILNDRLTSVRDYLNLLAERDNTRFVSQETGLSFAGLTGAIDTIQEEDVQWLTSYIVSNNLTKDKANLIDYYQYKIEDTERTLEQQETRLYTLNGLIDNYVKTNAVFPGVGGAGSGMENLPASVYEFSQPSEMYDDLINQKIETQTSISATQEQIAFYQRRIERFQNNAPSGNLETLQSHLESVYAKVAQLLEDIRRTSDDFFKTVELKRAFQTLEEPEAQGLKIFSTIKNSVYDIVIAEAALFGLYILSALWVVCLPKRRASLGAAQENATRSGTSKEKAFK